MKFAKEIALKLILGSHYRVSVKRSDTILIVEVCTVQKKRTGIPHRKKPAQAL